MFSKYFLMKDEDVISYVKVKLDSFDGNVVCKEIGDGNLNYVFRVENKQGMSVIVKQAGPQARISDDFILSTDRNRIETEVLQIQADYTPNSVPKIILLDEVMGACIMEDLKDFEIMRKKMMDFNIYPLFAEQIAEFMAENLMRTSDFIMKPLKKKELQKRFINPELCEITENLVYTEPYIDFKQQNILTEGNEEYITQHIYEDQDLHIKVAQLKQNFLTNAQALLHGDLHTGSIFINEKEIKVIDPEFAFFGPIGYDVGCLIANLTFAYMRAIAYKEQEFATWVITSLEETLIKFEEKSKIILQESKEPFAKYEKVLDNFLSNVLRESFAVSGLELLRRIIGLAKVADITTIQPLQKRIEIERLCLDLGKKCILNDDIRTIKKYLELLNKIRQGVEI